MDIPKFAQRLGSQQGAPRFEDLRERIKRLSEQTLDPYKTYRNQTEERITQFSEKMNQEYPDVLQAESLSADEQHERMNAVLKYCCQHFNYYRRHGFLELQGKRMSAKKACSTSQRGASPALSTPPLTRGVTKKTTRRRAVPRIGTLPPHHPGTRPILIHNLPTIKTERPSSPSPPPVFASPVPLSRSLAAPSPVLSQHLIETPSKEHTIKEELSEPSSTILSLPSHPAILADVPMHYEPIRHESVKNEPIKREPPVVKRELVKHESLAVKHELIKQEQLAVKRELVKQEQLAVKRELIKQELLTVKPELINEEPLAVKTESIKQEQLAVKHELIKQEPLIVKAELIKQEPLAVKTESIKQEQLAIKREPIKHEPIKHEEIKHERQVFRTTEIFSQEGEGQ